MNHKALQLARRIHAIYETPLTHKLVEELTNEPVYISEHPVHLRCNRCGLVQVRSFECPNGDGQLVVGGLSELEREVAEIVVQRYVNRFGSHPSFVQLKDAIEALLAARKVAFDPNPERTHENICTSPHPHTRD